MNDDTDFPIPNPYLDRISSDIIIKFLKKPYLTWVSFLSLFMDILLIFMTFVVIRGSASLCNFCKQQMIPNKCSFMSVMWNFKSLLYILNIICKLNKKTKQKT